MRNDSSIENIMKQTIKLNTLDDGKFKGLHVYEEE